jgi:hypothetical protein
VRFTSGPIAWAAEKVGAKETVALASTPQGDGMGQRGGTIGHNILDVVLSVPHQPFAPPRDAWLADLQVLCVRGAGSEGEQLVLAAKGGHNGEVHNHNDVGQFIVHWRGESLICDLGAPFYSKQTFGPRRYELLATRALGHNVPLVNGVEQAVGEEYRTRDVKCDIGPDEVTLSMDIAGAYPKEAGAQSLVRRLMLHRGRSEWVELTDEVRFAGAAGAYALPLYSVGRFEHAGEGKVRVVGRQAALVMEFDPSFVQAEIEDVRHGDGALEQRFGLTLPRCTLSLKVPGREAVVRVRFLLSK